VNRKRDGLLHRFKIEGNPILANDKEIDEKDVREDYVWQIPFIVPSAKERISYSTHCFKE
jgi:hypothetical protein